MSKLRITPKNDRKNKIRESENLPKKELIDNDLEVLKMYLNKNPNDFTVGDLKIFKMISSKCIKDFLENQIKINEKLSDISEFLISKENEVIIEKESSLETNKRIVIPDFFEPLAPLVSEIVEDHDRDGLRFLSILENTLLSVNNELKNDYVDVETLYNLLSEMLKQLQLYTIPQQKYIYRSIASCLNTKISKYYLVSPEDGSFIDPKLHKVVSGTGQRIERGLSFILLDKSSDEVVKFGNVKTN